MDKRYEVFCLVDRHFYETPDRAAAPAAPGGTHPEGWFETAQRPVPAGWSARRSGDWLHLMPPPPGEGGAAPMPAQGWKVHVSATLANADKTAAKVWDHCVPRGIPFKFVPARELLYLRNSKYAERHLSGKFATLYPADEDRLEVLLAELGELLDGGEGPYILTDLRIGRGPLYVRYGAFVPRWCDNGSGSLVPAIEDDWGRLVPDRRTPVFSLPEWVTLPAFLEPHLAARDGVVLGDLPYRIEGALHFSNGGGVYRATDLRTGERVVLKEARPHAGLAADGADAVTRLKRERAALERVSGLSVAPAVRDWFELGEHRFLVMDHLPGRTLNSFFAERHPLLAEAPDPGRLADYASWALDVHAGVERAVAALHGRGLVFNDLHMFNVMVAPDGRTVSLLDFEAAAPADENPRQIVAHPGFVAPADRTGYAVDRYALACLRLALFLPMTSLLAIDPAKAEHLAEVAAREFPTLPGAFLDEAVAEIRGAGNGRSPAAPISAAPTPAPAAARRPAPADWPGLRDALVRAILASATPEREDRLYPGDPAQFAPGGAERHEEGERWLLRRAAAPPEGSPLGLYDGLFGVVHTRHGLGHRQAALDLAERALGERWERLPAHLHGGLAGIGLVLDELAAATGESALAAHAERVTDLAAERLGDPPGPTRPGSPGDPSRPAPGRARAGLMRGASGAALLFVRRYERTRAPGLLDLAAAALTRDLAHCRADSHGTLAVDEGTRTMPYLAEGSVGIAAVLDDYLAHRADERLAAARAAILPAARLRYYAQPGLFRGRAGMIWHLARTATPGVTAADLDAQAAALDWYAMPWGGGLAFPGDQMMRLSMDLATGTAGCLLALAAAHRGDTGGRAPGLPFLPPPPGGGPQIPPPRDGGGARGTD
ncbi:class III lanthionine synthetase LanKC [Streptomyces sp. DSM 44917]|uniref:Class III lanthionine synthetase LanKC n=1 Tax=Streptomyces boetiae TaxID=3075541 RepID=A0ABU2LDH5_9ACTN|nr:class III lanthionine synthetase LanKC [Streptomyces sp. DSM 44917]MDT0309540.1 class III lanthionine synthetase LanKC [Streptomyces sp. DSM 44917]